jgi:hypothetical protein
LIEASIKIENTKMQSGAQGETNVCVSTLFNSSSFKQAYIFEDQKGDSGNNEKTVI